VDNDASGSLNAGDRVVIDIAQCVGTSTKVDATVTVLSPTELSATATFDVTRSPSATRAQGSVTYSFTATSQNPQPFAVAAAATGPTLTLPSAAVDYTTGGTVEKVQITSAAKTLEGGGSHYTVSFAGTVQSARFGGSFSFETTAPLVGD